MLKFEKIRRQKVKRKIQWFGFSAYPDGSSSKFRISGVVLHAERQRNSRSLCGCCTSFEVDFRRAERSIESRFFVSEGPRFKSRSAEYHKCLVDFESLSIQISVAVRPIRLGPLPSTSFPLHYSSSCYSTLYRVIQEKASMFWSVTVSVIV